MVAPAMTAPVTSTTVPVTSAWPLNGAAIMFDFEVERTALAGLADDAAGAIFDVDGEVVGGC